jgi:hypothetical protein
MKYDGWYSTFTLITSILAVFVSLIGLLYFHKLESLFFIILAIVNIICYLKLNDKLIEVTNIDWSRGIFLGVGILSLLSASYLIGK